MRFVATEIIRLCLSNRMFLPCIAAISCVGLPQVLRESTRKLQGSHNHIL